LGTRRRDIKLPDQFGETVGNALSDHVIIHGAELVADSRLDFGVKAALFAGYRILGGLRLYILHDLFHASPRVKSL
jgi:hypothetical protein